MKNFCTSEPFVLESGEVLPALTISYTTFGQLNNDSSNVVWIFHALTGNANPAEWWTNLVGVGKAIDPNKDFIICSNTLGSPYGTTSPVSVNPNTGEYYGEDFPFITIRDMVNAQKVLLDHLNIKKIQLGIGGSMGGQQLLEWAIDSPDLFKNICLLATNAKMSPWAIACNETQRMILGGNTPEALKAARAVAMLTYRTYDIYNKCQSEGTDEKVVDFKASSYQQYQGEKFLSRFDSASYLCLTKAMDSHNVGRGRGGYKKALQKIKANTLIFGVQSDLLFPIQEQKILRKYIKKADLKIIKSPYGHDGFLTEGDIIDKHLRLFRYKKQGWALSKSLRLVSQFLFSFFDLIKEAKIRRLNFESSPKSHQHPKCFFWRNFHFTQSLPIRKWFSRLNVHRHSPSGIVPAHPQAVLSLECPQDIHPLGSLVHAQASTNLGKSKFHLSVARQACQLPDKSKIIHFVIIATFRSGLNFQK